MADHAGDTEASGSPAIGDLSIFDRGEWWQSPDQFCYMAGVILPVLTAQRRWHLHFDEECAEK